MGDGYSQFFDQGTRTAILKKVKQEFAKSGSNMSSYAYDDNEEMFDVLEESVRLLLMGVK